MSGPTDCLIDRLKVEGEAENKGWEKEGEGGECLDQWDDY